MRETFERNCVPRLIGQALLIVSCSTAAVAAATWDPAAADYTGRKGTTLFVSKLGDSSDGSSWAKAFHTVQAALSAVPDVKGGHRIILRPDVYMEQNLRAAFEGAPGAYNVLEADFDGRLGSGATGYAILDAGDPKLGSTSGVINNFLQSKEVSGEVWDRWIVRRVYATGADAGVFWDIRQDFQRPTQPLTIIVEDCVGIGRAFGGGVAGHIHPRADEPTVFRRCQLWSLDWWGDAAGAYVRAENRAMPEHPDAIFEDCTLVGPDNALQAGNPGFDGYTRVKLERCNLISLNISMPEGCPSTGVIYSTIKGEYLHVDLEDSTLVGYKVFGAGGPQFRGFGGMHPGAADGGAISYTTRGKVRAYVRFSQTVPKGFQRLGRWPVDVFQTMLPPDPKTAEAKAARAERQAAARTKLEAQRAKRRAWFNEAKFGLFVHWGLYAVPASNSKGALASYKMKNEGIPVKEYEKYADQFKPTRFDATEWMRILKSAGMRYMILTSKHHEGFCMFDSKLTDYDAVDRAAKRDFVRELIAAARAAGVKIGFYYSALDWHQPDYKTDLAKYVREYMHPQMRELCTNYGPIDCIWLDGEWDHPAAAWRVDEFVGMIRKLQPDAVINDRLGKGERGKNLLCDFYTREQPVEIRKATAFEKQRPHPWEACLTIGTSWGYKKGDAPLKSARDLIRTLVDVASRGGNVLLNVGPTADGEIPAPFVSRLKEIGDWLAKNGESIYGTHGSPFSSLPAGKCTTKESRLYVHLDSHPGPKLTLPGLQNEIKRAWLLSTGRDVGFDDAAKTIAIPERLPEESVTTVAVELNGKPAVK